MSVETLRQTLIQATAKGSRTVVVMARDLKALGLEDIAEPPAPKQSIAMAVCNRERLHEALRSQTGVSRPQPFSVPVSNDPQPSDDDET